MFERFTDRARRVLVLAQEEARHLNHSFIGTEHVLLGLVAERDGIGARALDVLGVSLDGVRRQVVDRLVPSAPPGTAVTPPFTAGSKRALELAMAEALLLGHNYIGTEHLLLGLLREGEGVAAQVLADLGVEQEQVRTMVLRLVSDEAASAALPEAGGDDSPEGRWPVSAVFSVDDAKAVLGDVPVAVDGRDDRTMLDGVRYATCTYRARPLPEIAVTVTGADVSREAFDEYTDRLGGSAEVVEGLGDAATFSQTGRSLRVLTGPLLFVVVVGHHADARDLAVSVARRALANVAGQPPPG